jgi:hypothetical protein
MGSSTPRRSRSSANLTGPGSRLVDDEARVTVRNVLGHLEEDRIAVVRGASERVDLPAGTDTGVEW